MLERFIANPSAANFVLLIVFLVFGSFFYTFMFEGRAGVAEGLRFHALTWPLWLGSGVAIGMWFSGEWGSGFAALSVGVLVTALLVRRARRAS